MPLNELHSRKLHFSVYDFDRFSRHDLIGQVVVDNLLDFSEGSGDKPIWRDIVEGTAVRNLPELLPVIFAVTMFRYVCPRPPTVNTICMSNVLILAMRTSRADEVPRGTV